MDVLQNYLTDHLDRALVNWAINGFTCGFKLGLTRFPPPRDECKNAKSWQPEVGNIFNEEGMVLRAPDDLLIWNLRDVIHSKPDVWNKIGNRLQFRLYSLVKDTPKMAQDDYFEEGTNEAYLVHKSS